MFLPTDLQSVQAAFGAVAANTLATITPLAAPGAGLQYRIWGWAGAHTNTNQTPLRDWWFLTNNVVTLTQASSTGFEGPVVNIPGGLAWGTNRVVVAAVVGDLLNVARGIVILYTIENT